jgi:putative ABC transport system permease protein
MSDYLRRNLLENVRLARTALTAHKLRAFLTIVGIVIGVWTVIGMVALVTGFNRSTTESFSSFGTTLVQFQKWEPRFGGGHRITEEERKRRDLTYEDAEAIARLCPSIRSVSPERYFWGAAQVKNLKGDEASSPTVAGGTQNYDICNNWLIQDGRGLIEQDVQYATDVAIIGSDVVKTLFAGKDPIGQVLTVNGRRFTVMGTYVKKGGAMGGNPDNFVLIPFSTFDRYFPQIKNSRGDTIHIATIPWNPEDVHKAVEEGTNVLRARRKVPFDKPNDFAVWTAEKMIAQMQAVTGAISGVMVFIAAIALLVGGVGVMNIMLVSVTERTKEIGLRKSVGALRRDIVLQFLMEAVTLTFLGGALGVTLGLGTAVLVRTITPLQTATPLWSVFLGLGVSVSIGLFFGLYPAVKASRLDPIEALRYE